MYYVMIQNVLSVLLLSNRIFICFLSPKSRWFKVDERGKLSKYSFLRLWMVLIKMVQTITIKILIVVFVVIKILMMTENVIVMDRTERPVTMIKSIRMPLTRSLNLTVDLCHVNYFITKKSIYTIMHTPFYTFCTRNKPWSYTEFLS